MKARLPALKTTRLPWFDENTSVEVKREVELKYSKENVLLDKLLLNVQRQYLFRFIKEKNVPASELIMAVEGMPFLMTETQGNIGEKLLTNKITDSTVTVTDLIAKRERGEEKVTVEDLPYKKQITETRIREDKVNRRIIIKNESGKGISVNLKLIESGEVQILKSNPSPDKKEKPIYEWTVSLEKDTEKGIELEISCIIETIRNIERETENKNLKQ